MANLRIEGKRIEQDRVEILGNCLKGKDAKRWVDEYIEFIFECWKNGFSEKTYNFTINHGVALNRKIVLVDFGELNFTKSKIKGEIKSQRRKKSWSFKEDLDNDLRKYYGKKMRDNLTLSNLEKYWKS